MTTRLLASCFRVQIWLAPKKKVAARSSGCGKDWPQLPLPPSLLPLPLLLLPPLPPLLLPATGCSLFAGSLLAGFRLLAARRGCCSLLHAVR